uniref:serine/threonine protein kinase n=1 Tax=Alistipes sp. TaxID=1872444 RepID=UPI004056DBFE
MQPNDLLLNRYRLSKSIGRGSFGEVWMAYDEVADLEVAIKIYVALDNHGLEEFRQEFKGVHDLIHQNILRPEHFDVADSCPFLVMPLCEGSVERKIGKMNEREVWQLLRDVSAGLSFLHQKEIIHRDIKPDNILLNREGRFLISDFGISTELRSTLMRSSTGQHQNISGTIPYMGPELFTKHPLAVKATDVWALGATLFEVMEGQLPFFGQGGGMLNHGAAIPALGGAWSPALRDTVEAMLSHETWQRPTAEELRTYAEAQLKGQTVAMPWLNRGKDGDNGGDGGKDGNDD